MAKAEGSKQVIALLSAESEEYARVISRFLLHKVGKHRSMLYIIRLYLT
jgi:hypothetical protein